MNEETEFEGLEEWLLIIVITLIGGWLRVFMLDKKGLWLDEAFSVWLAKHSLAGMLQWSARVDIHPPLYYFLLHYWIAFKGDTPFNVRLLSALFGTATIPVVYLIGKRISGSAMGLAAAVLLVFSPFNIRYAQEARMYTLMLFTTAVAIYTLARLLTDPRSCRPIGSQFREYLRAWRTSGPPGADTSNKFSYKDETRRRSGLSAWITRHHWLPIQAVETDLAWAGFIVFSAAAMLSHSAAVFFPLAVNIFVVGLLLFRRIKRPGSPPGLQTPSFWNWVVAQAAIFLLWSPWLLTFLKQAGSVYREFWVPSPGWNSVIQAVKSFLNFSVMGDAGQVMLVWILYGLVFCLALVDCWKHRSRFLFLASLFAVPILGELVVSIRRPIFLDRTLIWVTVPLFLLLAVGISRLRLRFLIVVAVGILGCYNLFSASDYYRFMQNEDWNDPAGNIAYSAQAGDLVLFNSPWVQLPFDYYFNYFEGLYSIQVEKHGVPVDISESDSLEPRMTIGDIPKLVSLMSGHKRVWLVYSHNLITDPNGLIPQTLAAQNLTLTLERDYYGVQVFLYEAP